MFRVLRKSWAARVAAPMAVSLVVLVSACSASVSRGATLYDQGRYVEAAEVFERTEHRLSESDTAERAEYALYRGLTFLALGDLQHARQWLAHAQRIAREQPDTFDEKQHGRLNDGWKQLAGAKVASPPSFDPPTSAFLRSPNGLTPTSRSVNGARSVGSGN